MLIRLINQGPPRNHGQVNPTQSVCEGGAEGGEWAGKRNAFSNPIDSYFAFSQKRRAHNCSLQVSLRVLQIDVYSIVFVV